ncbi:MAG: hypothetical protein PHH82_04095 [Candidatus ainarchaeum sp.]|nr:hypothetical protein [Candidatus ainarchaeum sp.]
MEPRKPGRVSGHVTKLILSRRARERHQMKKQFEKIMEDMKRRERDKHAEKMVWERRNDSVHQLSGFLDACSPEEVKFYNRFMKDHPGQSIDERIIFAERVVSVMIHLRSYSNAERLYFNKQVKEMGKKTPEERIGFIYRLNDKIDAFRDIKNLSAAGRQFFNKYFRILVREKKDLPERIRSLISVALSSQSFSKKERDFFDKFMSDVAKKPIEEKIERMVELRKVILYSEARGESIDAFDTSLIGDEKTWPGN